MLDTLRIIIAGTLLFGTTLFNAPVQAGGPSRILPREVQPAKTDPCRAAWPYVIRSCVA